MSQEYVDQAAPNVSRICQRVETSSQIVMIEAPKGFGKSLLAQHLVDGPMGFTRIDGPDLIDHPSAIASEAALVIDGVTETLPPELLDTLCGEGRQIVITGRDLSHLVRWASGKNVLRLSANDLALSRDDIRVLADQVLGSNEAKVFADATLSLSRGWPALVCALLLDAEQTESGRSGVPSERWTHGPHVSLLVEECLAGLDDSSLDSFGQLAHLPSFSASCVTAIAGPGGLARARANGLPVVQRGDGWLGIARPVKEALQARGAFRTLSAELLGPVLVASGGLLFAAKALLAAGDALVAAELLCSVPGYRFDDHNQAELAGMIRSLDSQLDPEPELMLLLARVHLNRAEIDQQRVALQEAERRALAVGNLEAELEAQTELLFLDLGEGQEDLLSRLDALEARVTEQTTSSTRARLREVRAMYLAQTEELANVYASMTLFKDASYEWESLGEPGRAAWTLRLFAAVPCWHLGHYREALDALERASLLVESKPASLIKTLGMAARLAAAAGDRDRLSTLISQIEVLPASHSLGWVEGFVSWAEMTISSLEGDAGGAQVARIHAETLLGPLLNHPTGVVFLADSSMVAALVGDAEHALLTLGKAKERSDEAPLEVHLAEIIVHARVGEAERVPDLVATLDASGTLPFERRWRMELETLLAHSRMCGVAPDEEALAKIKHQADNLGLELLWDQLLQRFGLVLPSAAPSTSMILLGSFSVVAGQATGSKVLPPGHSTQMVKYLAAAGGDVPVEVVIEILWPDGDPDKGRKRLRNVINRARAALGPDSVLRTGDLIRLGPEVKTDLAQFRELGSQALTGSETETERAARAVRALNLYQGDLLPDDLYSDWVDGHRETARLTAIGLLDLILAHPTHEVVPSWLLETAGRVGAKTESLWVDIARFADRHGAMECCRVAALRAEAVAHDLGLEPSEAAMKLLANYR